MANDTVTKAQIQVTPFDPDTRYMVQALYDIGDAIVKESTTFRHGVMKDKIDALVANHKLYLDDAATLQQDVLLHGVAQIFRVRPSDMCGRCRGVCE